MRDRPAPPTPRRAAALVLVLAAACNRSAPEGAARPAVSAERTAPPAAPATNPAPTPPPAAGDFAMVDAAPGDLAAVLRAQAALAQGRGLHPFAYLHASWCGPCNALEHAMGDPAMVAAFRGTYVVRFDVDAWGPALEAGGLHGNAIPAFFQLDAQGHPTGRSINGGAWGEDVPANMAPPLRAFFQGG